MNSTAEEPRTSDIYFNWKAIDELQRAFVFSELEMTKILGELSSELFEAGIKLKNISLNSDQKERLSILLGIYKGLRALFEDSKQAVTWIDRDNQLAPFNGCKPRAFIVSGDKQLLKNVRAFVDYQLQ